METVPCTVYNDVTGDVVLSARFVVSPSGRLPGTNAYAAFDGGRILLIDGGALVPTVSPRPRGVSASAVLSENGVWVDCRPAGASTFACSLFLAASGKELARGKYMCDSTEGCLPLVPKNASVAEIWLRGGAMLRRSSNGV
jgi:hypothetical protein